MIDYYRSEDKAINGESAIAAEVEFSGGGDFSYVN